MRRLDFNKIAKGNKPKEKKKKPQHKHNNDFGVFRKEILKLSEGKD